MSELKTKTLYGFIWALLERFGVQFVSFGVSLVLARLLTPSDYGAVAILLIFIAIAEILASAGFGTALVQKKDALPIDFNTVFCISMSASAVLYIALFLLAPRIAQFFRHPDLVTLFRVQAIALFFHAFAGIQNAEISRRMLFKLSFRIGIMTCVISSVVGLSCALLGLGPWALVWMTFSSAASGIVIKLFVCEWKPRLEFSSHAAIGLWRYGWKLAASSLLDRIYNNLYGFLIGRFYSSEDLAFVNKGRSSPALAMNALNGTICRVAFPMLVKLQSNPILLREAMRKLMRTSTFVVFPAMIGLGACAQSLIPLLFGEQWVPSVVYVQLACFDFALYPFHTINLQGVKAIGRSDWFLLLEIIKKVLGISLILASIRYGVFAMMLVSACVGGPLCVLINAWPNRRLLAYSIDMQVRDALPAASISMIMGMIIFPLNWVCLPGWLIVLMQLPLGFITYFLLAWLFRLDSLTELLRLISPIVSQLNIQYRFIKKT